MELRQSLILAMYASYDMCDNTECINLYVYDSLMHESSAVICTWRDEKGHQNCSSALKKISFATFIKGPLWWRTLNYITGISKVKKQ